MTGYMRLQRQHTVGRLTGQMRRTVEILPLQFRGDVERLGTSLY
jgi:hypothetical protein